MYAYRTTEQSPYISKRDFDETETMKASDFDTSNYLNAKTAGEYNGKTLTIYEVKAETVRDQRKLTIGFEGVEKALIVNKTNRVALSEAYGDDTDDWVGKSALLLIVMVMFEGKRTPSILLEPKPITPVIDAEAPHKKKK